MSTEGTRRGLVSGAIASVFTTALAQRVGATPEMLPGYATSEKLLPEDAYIGFNGDTKEVTMTMDHYESLYAAANPAMQTTGLSWETLQFNTEHRTLDWDSGPLGGWNRPDSHIMGAAMVWKSESEAMIEPTVYGILSASSRDDILPAIRKSYAGWALNEDTFWDWIEKQIPYGGRFTVRVYYTTIVPAVD